MALLACGLGSGRLEGTGFLKELLHKFGGATVSFVSAQEFGPQ